MTVFRLAIFVAVFAFVPAIFMTVTICGWEGLSSEHFSVVRTCSVTDPPREVFVSFLVIGAIIGVIAISLYQFFRWVSK